jgi:gliding motility-associated-like protein
MKHLKQLIFFFSVILSWTVQSQSSAGSISGGAKYCDSVNSGFISITNYNGTILDWQYSTNNGQNWNSTGNSTSTQSYYNITKTTCYRAIVKNGSSPADTSSVSTVTVHITSIIGNISGGGRFCGGSGIGTILLSGTSGNVTNWQMNNGDGWTNINNTSTSLSHATISKNTFYRAIILDVAGCPADTSKIASFIIDPTTVAGSISKSDSVCSGSPGDTLFLTGFTGQIIDWLISNNNGNNWTSLGHQETTLTYSAPAQTTWYKTVIKSGSACNTETTTAVVIAVFGIHPANAGQDVTITRHEKITLNASGEGVASWNFGTTLSDSTVLNPSASPLNTTSYTLTLTDENGCKSNDEVTVNVIVPVPTAISPNGDGTNDFFEIDKITQFENSSLTVYNRWGAIVFKAAPYVNQWNGKCTSGKDLPDDTYYYVLDYGNGEKPTTNYILIKR